MSNEDIIKEIEKASKMVREAARDVNVALCHSRNVVENEDNEKAYNKGLEDVWKFLKAFCGMDVGERQKVFGEYVVGKLVENMSPQEAFTKLEAYEKEQNEIKVGDVVEQIGTENHYLIITEENDGSVYDFGVIDLDSMEVDRICNDTRYFKKTGRHIDITSVLEQLRGDKDENN